MAAAMLLSCGDADDGGPGPDDGDLDEYVEAVTSEDGSVAASKRSGEPPEEGDGPDAQVQTTSALILGGSARFVLTSTSQFSRLIVTVDDADGFYELLLGAATNVATIVVRLPQEVDEQTFTLGFAVAEDEDAEIGGYARITWPEGQAAAGTYTVRVDWWDNCEATKTNYAVTVRVKGREPQTLHRTFTGEEDQGGLGAAESITTFTVDADGARRVSR